MEAGKIGVFKANLQATSSREAGVEGLKCKHLQPL
jgi:hypothetical protein